MDTFLFKNNAVSTLAVGVDAVVTSLVLASGEGVRFPSPAAGQRFPITLVDAGGNKEVCYCSARSGDTLTVSRGEESISAKTWQIGDTVSLRVTEGVMQQVLQGDSQVITDTNADMVDGFNASASAQADTLLALDNNAELPATVANALLLENNDSAYHLDRANHTGFQDVDAFSGRIGSELFTVDGTFTVPLGVTEIRVLAAGGGGGGGGGEVYPISGGDGENGYGGKAGQLYWANKTVVGGATMGVDIGGGGAGGAGGTYPSYGENGVTGTDGEDTHLTGPIANAGALVIGDTYTIVTLGTTDFTLVGASVNVIGTVFVATGAGTGTGTADETIRWLGGDGGKGGGITGGGGGGGGDGESQEPYSDAYGTVGSTGPGAGGAGTSPDSNGHLGGEGAGAGGGGGGGSGTNTNGGNGGAGGKGFMLISW